MTDAEELTNKFFDIQDMTKRFTAGFCFLLPSLELSIDPYLENCAQRILRCLVTFSINHAKAWPKTVRRTR